MQRPRKTVSKNDRVGMLTVLGEPQPFHVWRHSKRLGRDAPYKEYRVSCLCDCGNEKSVLLANLLKGSNTRSCGCLKRRMFGERNKDNATHGMSYASEYRIWCGMKARCHNTNDPAYERYGKRGIAVCEEWRASFESFFGHIGPRPGPEYSVDRIDNQRGYEHGNVRWATATQQQSNARRTRIMLTGPDGRMMSAKEWAAEIGVTASTLKERLRKGITGDDLFAPHRHYGRSRL